MKFFSFIISIFTNKKCYGCQQSWHFFCSCCNDKMEKYLPYCYVCKWTSPWFLVHEKCEKELPLKQVLVLTRYRHIWVKKLLRHGKYYWKYWVYTELILHNERFFKEYVKKENALLFPVPIHFLRGWKRGYNQSLKIAHILSSILDMAVNNKVIYKKKYTKNQSHLSRNLRQKNVTHSFWVRKNMLSKDITIYLVDDVISTGSTLAEITRILHKDGFSDIRAIVLASD